MCSFSFGNNPRGFLASELLGKYEIGRTPENSERWALWVYLALQCFKKAAHHHLKNNYGWAINAGQPAIPTSCERILKQIPVEVLELHVFYVPAELWNSKLNTVSNHAISKFVSAGFVRVLPDLSLKALRQQIADLLGTHLLDDKFVFLKSVGRSLAVVWAKQELELKVKSFAPPYAPQPELYLLPGAGRRHPHHTFTPRGQPLPADGFGTYAPHPRPRDRGLDENESSGDLKSSGRCSQAHFVQSPDVHSDCLSYDRSQNANHEENAKPRGCKADDFSQPAHRTGSPDIAYTPVHQRSPDPGQITDSREFKTNGFSQDIQSTRSPSFSNDWKQETPRKSLQNTRHSNQKLLRKQQQEHRVCQETKETAATRVAQKDISSVSEESRIPSNSTRDSGIQESLDERDLEYSENQRKKGRQVNKAPESFNAEQRTNQVQNDGYSPMTPPVTKHYSLPPPPSPLPTFNPKSQLESAPTDKEQLIAEINATKQERKYLEKTREELVKKVRGLLSQNRLRRNEVRDKWKKKYFETKKVTTPLEETSSKLRQELEAYYLKLLQQLEARDTRKQSRNSTSNSKNELIIQITTLKHEMDQLYRSVENAKIKLITEIKLRKQTSTDLRALRAELAQKKTQSSLNRMHGDSVPHSLNVSAS